MKTKHMKPISNPLKEVLYFTLVTLTLFFACSSSASAGVPSELHYMVSPPSCQPISPTHWDRLKLENGVWVFRNAVSDEVAVLYCAVNFYGAVGDFEHIQLWYIDEFNEDPPVGHFGYVQAILKRRSRTSGGSWVVADIASSDGDLGHDFVNNFSVPEGPRVGRSFYVEVRMYRQSTTAMVGFVGLAINIQ